MVDNKKKPDPADIHVGSRIRLRRTTLGISQEKLGEHLGVTFQQIQKYEKGANRVGSGRLHRIAAFFGVPESFFYDGMSDARSDGSDTPGSFQEPPGPEYTADFLSTPEGAQLSQAFLRIRDRKVRRRVVDLVRALADAEPDAPA